MHSRQPYYSLRRLIEFIDEPNRSSCLRLLERHGQLFQQAPGSTHNHQAWAGGYWDHITEAMNLWMLLHATFEGTGRLAQLPPEEQFSRSDGLLVLFLHDIEKPWACPLVDGRPIPKASGRLESHPAFYDKSNRRAFAANVIAQWHFQLSPAHRNALTYVEGIRDADYTPGARLMLPLAALCHTCDLLSARMFYGFPLVRGNAWGERLF